MMVRLNLNDYNRFKSYFIADNIKMGKLPYDRDFLLKFQCASVCKLKPAGLPDIDIVLSQAHAPTKPLVPGQRLDII